MPRQSASLAGAQAPYILSLEAAFRPSYLAVAATPVVRYDDGMTAAGVGLVLDRAMDGTLHIIEVVPGGAGTLRRPSCRSRETRLLPPAAACLISPRTDWCGCGWMQLRRTGASIGYCQPAHPPAARTRTPPPSCRRNAFVHAWPFRARRGPHCGSPHARAGMRRATSCLA